jgi:hypothetical protein
MILTGGGAGLEPGLSLLRKAWLLLLTEASPADRGAGVFVGDVGHSSRHQSPLYARLWWLYLQM